MLKPLLRKITIAKEKIFFTKDFSVRNELVRFVLWLLRDLEIKESCALLKFPKFSPILTLNPLTLPMIFIELLLQ